MPRSCALPAWVNANAVKARLSLENTHTPEDLWATNAYWLGPENQEGIHPPHELSTERQSVVVGAGLNELMLYVTEGVTLVRL
jgi:hypothetical protein